MKKIIVSIFGFLFINFFAISCGSKNCDENALSLTESTCKCDLVCAKNYECRLFFDKFDDQIKEECILEKINCSTNMDCPIDSVCVEQRCESAQCVDACDKEHNCIFSPSQGPICIAK